MCKDASFTILAFNVRGFNVENDINKEDVNKNIVSFVKKQNPDIIAFQEFSRFEFKSFSEYPYKFIGYREEMIKSLQVIYSRFPIINSGYIDFPNTRNGVIYADIQFENEVIRVYNLHLQSFGIEMNSERVKSNRFIGAYNKISKALKLQKEQALKVINHIKSFKGKTIVCGDFNSTQFSTTYNILKEDMKDSFIEEGNGLGTTYRLFNFPLRLDYVLVDDDFETVSHQNFKLELSDHEPILVRVSTN